MRFCFCLSRSLFYREIRAVILALVLASLVKTRLKDGLAVVANASHEKSIRKKLNPVCLFFICLRALASLSA